MDSRLTPIIMKSISMKKSSTKKKAMKIRVNIENFSLF